MSTEVTPVFNLGGVLHEAGTSIPDQSGPGDCLMDWTLLQCRAMSPRDGEVLWGDIEMIYAIRAYVTAAILSMSLMAIGETSAETVVTIKVIEVGNQ